MFVAYCVFLGFACIAFCKPPSEAGLDAPVAIIAQDARDTTAVFTLDYLCGHFNPAAHPDFAEIDTQYADRPGMYLRKEVYRAFIEMFEAAQQDSIHLVIRSAARNFDYQKGIWERKWTGETTIEGGKRAPVAYPDPKARASAILKFSAMPGTSRHHWGTDIDLNAFENTWFESGEGQRIYAWLVAHTAEYGFCQPYTQKGPARPDGYEEEKWHWSYVPTAMQLMQLARDSLQHAMITGFMGAEVAADLEVTEKYVLGIAQECAGR